MRSKTHSEIKWASSTFTYVYEVTRRNLKKKKSKEKSKMRMISSKKNLIGVRNYFWMTHR